MNIYQLYLNDKKQITGYSKIDEVKDGDIVFPEQDLALVDSYMKPKNVEQFYEMGQIKEWLIKNDYKINKHALGEYSDTDTRWTTYLKERKEKLSIYNELELLLEKVELPVFDIKLLSPIKEETPTEEV